MSKKITKISKLLHPASFLQLNTIRGYEYIDRAGKIVNEYHLEGETPPNFTMSLGGLTIENPKPKITTLRVSSNVIWLHFEKPDSLDLVLNNAISEFKKLVNLLNVKELKRIGWRNYFIYEAKDENEVNEIFSKNNKLTNNLKMEMLGYLIEKPIEEIKFDGILSISKVFSKPEEGKEKYGILFDIDLFVKNKAKIEDMDKILRAFKEYLGKDKFLSVINNFIS